MSRADRHKSFVLATVHPRTDDGYTGHRLPLRLKVDLYVASVSWPLLGSRVGVDLCSPAHVVEGRVGIDSFGKVANGLFSSFSNHYRMYKYDESCSKSFDRPAETRIGLVSKLWSNFRHSITNLRKRTFALEPTLFIVCMDITYSRVWINRVRRLPILLVVS